MNLQKKSKVQITQIFNIFQILIVIKDNFKYSKGVGRCLQIISTLYPLSILILHSLQKQSGEFYIFSLILIRPEILLFQAIGLWGLEGYLFSAVIYLIQKLSFGFFVFTQKVRIESNLNKFNRWIYYYLAIYQTFFFQVLLIPLTLICMQSYNVGITQHNIVSIFFSIFMFILLQLDAIIFLYLNEPTLTYHMRALDKTKITFYDVISYTLKLTQIALYGFYQNEAAYPSIQAILVFFISVIEMANQYINQSYIHKSNRLVLYTMNLLAATISFFYFIDLQSANSNLTFSFTLLLYPLILQLILYLDKEYQILCFFSQFSHKEQNLPYLFHQLIKIANFCDTQDLKKAIKYSLILTQHKESCKDIQCFCSHNYNFIDITNQNSGGESIEKRLFQSCFNFIAKIVFKNRTHPQTLYKFCALLYTFDYQIQATKYFYITLGMSDELSDEISLFKTSSKQKCSSRSLSESHSHHIKQAQFYRRYSLPLILEMKIRYLISEVKRKMNIQLSNQTHSQHEFSEQIQKFYQNEGQLLQNVDLVKKVLFEKIQFYIEFTKSKELNFDKFSQSVISYNSSIIRLAVKLKNRYSFFPSKKLLQTICYLESEINNDLVEGLKYQNMNAISEEKLLQLSSNAFFNFYSDDVAYIIFEVEEDLQNLKILSCSSNFKFPGKQLTFNAILPRFIVHEHPILVGNFLKLGQSKFYRKFKQGFIRNKDGFTGSMQLCFDTIHSLESEKMTFIAFIKQSQEYSAFLMVDINKQIGSMTKMFLQKCGYSEDFIQQYGITEKIFNSIRITHLIPSFNQILEQNQDMHIIKSNNIEFYFYDLEQYQEEINNQMHSETINSRNIIDQCRMIEYRIDVAITKHEIYEFNYFVLELLVANKLTNEQVIKDHFTNRGSSEFNITELNMSFDELKINQMSNHSQSNENDISQEKIQQKEDIYNEMNMDQEFQLQSPNQSNFDRSSFNAHSQQKYFNKANNISFDQQQSNISKLANELSEQKKQDQEASKPSSIYGIKSYKYFKKYELYNRASKKGLSKPLQMCTAFLLLQLLINIIFSNIILTILHNDIARFIKEIDMISLHASIMGPHDLFYGVRATISAYQQLNREGYIDKNLTEELVDPLYQYIGLGYDELRVNFYELLSNQYLQDFFTNVTRTAYFMKDNDTNVYPLSLNFKEQLLVELAYQFQFKRTFEKRGSAAGKAFQVFQYANYFKLHQTLEALTVQIMQYSRTRSEYVQSKWEIIWIFFMLAHFLICCIILYYLHYQASLKDKFLKLFLLVDHNLLKIELDRLKELYNAIEKNPESVLEYQFTIQDKSIKQISNISQLSNRYMKANDKFDKYKLTRAYAIIQMLLFFGIFCIYSTLINEKTSSYLDRYKETTEFYKLIQDLRFRSGNIYLYREIRMRWSNFTYLTDEDYNLLYVLIDHSKQVMKTYLYDYITPQFDKYLCSESFVKFYFSVQNTDLCNFITQDYLQFMGRYCTAGLEGTVTEGMIPCLTFILNSIETQQAINNFTHREEVYFYEAESGYIVTRVFVNMSEQLKTGMIEITETKNQFDNILSGLNLTFCIVLGFLALFVLRDYYNNEFYYVRKIINLLPLCVLLNDDSLERILRQYLVSQEF